MSQTEADDIETNTKEYNAMRTRYGIHHFFLQLDAGSRYVHQAHNSEFAKDPHLETCFGRGAGCMPGWSGLTHSGYPSDGARRWSFLPDNLPDLSLRTRCADV